MFFNVLAALNALLGLIVAWYSLRGFREARGQSWAWLKLAHLALGLYWAGIYGFVLLNEPQGYDAVLFGQVFIRPALTITLAVLAAGALIGVKR